MIRHISNFSIFLIFSIYLSSCEKDITIKLDPTTTDLVVDASIENGKYPTVTLSRSLDYFSRLDPHLLTKSFVHGARVLMSNGSITAQLQEYSITDDSTGQLLYYYSLTDSYSGPKFKGEFSTTYNLQIEVENKSYTAKTTIPGLNKIIDSLWWVPAPPSVDSSLVNVKAKVTDPAGSPARSTDPTMATVPGWSRRATRRRRRRGWWRSTGRWPTSISSGRRPACRPCRPRRRRGPGPASSSGRLSSRVRRDRRPGSRGRGLADRGGSRNRAPGEPPRARPSRPERLRSRGPGRGPCHHPRPDRGSVGRGRRRGRGRTAAPRPRGDEDAERAAGAGRRRDERIPIAEATMSGRTPTDGSRGRRSRPGTSLPSVPARTRPRAARRIPGGQSSARPERRERFATSSGIPIADVYTGADAAGFAPRRRPRAPGRVPVHARRPADDVPRPALDDAPVRRLRHRRRDERALPLPARRRARPGSRWPSTCRRRWATTPTTRSRRARSARSASRSRRSTTWSAARRAPARQGHDVDDDQRHGADPAGVLRRGRRTTQGVPRGRCSAARSRTTSSRSTSRAGPTSTRRGRRCASITDMFEFWCARAAAVEHDLDLAATTCARPARRPCRRSPSRSPTRSPTATRRVARGLDVDDVRARACRSSSTATANFFEEVAKFRAARRMWARIVRERFGAPNPTLVKLPLPHPDRGLDADRAAARQQRRAHDLQALAAVLGGTQSPPHERAATRRSGCPPRRRRGSRCARSR